MAKTVDDYVAALSGRQAETVTALRTAILANSGVAEAFKWGHPIYECGGPMCLIKSHKSHVTLGLWRGAKMRKLDPRLEASGSFQMASIKLTQTDAIDKVQIERLVEAGIALDREQSDPTKAF